MGKHAAKLAFHAAGTIDKTCVKASRWLLVRCMNHVCKLPQIACWAALPAPVQQPDGSSILKSTAPLSNARTWLNVLNIITSRVTVTAGLGGALAVIMQHRGLPVSQLRNNLAGCDFDMWKLVTDVLSEVIILQVQLVLSLLAAAVLTVCRTCLTRLTFKP